MRTGTLVLLVVALLLVAVVALWGAPLRALLWQALAPALALRNALGSSEVAALRDSLARAEARAADRDLIAQDNMQLRTMLGRTELAGTRVLAAVLMRPPATPYDTLAIDVGTRHGVGVGSKVSMGGDVMLGEVAEVHESTATVRLYSSPGSEYRGLVVHGAHSTPVALLGQGAGSFVAQVPSGTAAGPGDTVVFEGLPGVAGVVSAVREREGESFMYIYTHLPASISDLRYVEVVLP